MLEVLTDLLFPSKCAFCRCLLSREETDLCHHCRTAAPVFPKSKRSHSFVARWTAVWYYKGDVRSSLLRYKFGRRRSYAPFYGRQLAMKLVSAGLDDFDILTWVPIGPVRKLTRGFDQAELIARAVGAELGVPVQRCLVKRRDNPAQSGITEPAQRRANVANMYRVCSQEALTGKRILLIDDIITTGATLSECARTLLLAGGAEVTGAAVAAASREKDKCR